MAREPETVEELLDGTGEPRPVRLRRRGFEVAVHDTIDNGRVVRVTAQVDPERIPLAIRIANLRWALSPAPDSVVWS